MPTPEPLVSVIVPAYQAQATLGGAISGILTQSYPNVECVVVDDGSTDRTAAVAEAFGPPVRVIRQENAGTAAARNAAIAQAHGEFIALCDSDDILLPPYLQLAMETWRHAGGGRRFVTCDALLLTGAGLGHGRRFMAVPVAPAPRQRLAILEANFVSGFALMPRDMLIELGGYRDGYVEDWDLWIRAIYAGWEAVAQPDPQALYRWSDTSKSTRSDEVFAAEDALLRRFAQERRADLRPDESAYLDARLAAESPRVLTYRSDEALRRGDFTAAREHAVEAARLFPSNRRLRLKAESMRRFPPSARFWQRRLVRIDDAMGRDTEVNR